MVVTKVLVGRLVPVSVLCHCICCGLVRLDTHDSSDGFGRLHALDGHYIGI